MPAPASRVPSDRGQPLTGQHPVTRCPHIGQGRSLNRLEQRVGVSVQRPAATLTDLDRGESQPGLHHRAQPVRVFFLDEPQQPHQLLHPPVRRCAGVPVPGDQARLEGIQKLRAQILQIQLAVRVPGLGQVGDELGQRGRVAVRRTHVLLAALHSGQSCQRPGQVPHQPRARQRGEVVAPLDPAREPRGEHHRTQRRDRLRLGRHLLRRGEPHPATHDAAPARSSATLCASHSANAASTISCASSSTSRYT